jgi:glucosamine-6-phosphate deaminase
MHMCSAISCRHWLTIRRRLIIRDDPHAASKYIADYIIGAAAQPLCAQPASTNSNAERINAFQPTPEKPFVLGLPTGSSPVLIYQNLVRRHKAGEISFRHVVTFNMVRSAP